MQKFPGAKPSRATWLMCPLTCRITTASTRIPHAPSADATQPNHRYLSHGSGAEKAKMCRTYKLDCPLYQKTNLQHFYSVELHKRRREHSARTASNTIPRTQHTTAAATTPAVISLDMLSEHGCPSYSVNTKAIVPAFSYAPPNYTALKHACRAATSDSGIV